LEPNDTAAFDSRGFTHLKIGQWDSAIQITAQRYNINRGSQPRFMGADLRS
jgi:hypothetical protein